MTKLKIERRKHKRYKVKQGIFAALESDKRRKLGQIIEISKQGLSMEYLFDQALSFGSVEVKIYSATHNVKLKLPAKIVDDFVTAPAFTFSSIPTGHLNLQFEGMTPEQESHLDCFIQNHTHK